MRLFINLTPFIPLSLKGEGEEILERGFAPLLLTLLLPLVREGGQGDRLLNDLNKFCLTITYLSTKLKWELIMLHFPFSIPDF
jgi:hypothetical protein